MFKVFISSNQTEFEKERQFIKKEFEADYFLKSFFKVFLFEDSPSFGLSPETTYFEEVRKSDVYIGLIGSDYGTIKDNGLSPTEEEYDEFHASNPDSFFYIQNVDKRDAESERFILKIQPDNKYSFFDTNQDLIDEIKKSLVKYIERGQKDNDNFDKKLILNSSPLSPRTTSSWIFVSSLHTATLRSENASATASSAETIRFGLS